VNGAQLERAEAAAFESIARAGDWPRLRIGDAVCIAVPAAPGNTMFNRVTGLGLDGDASDDALDKIAAFFRDAGTQYAIAMSPVAPRDLAGRLKARGFEAGYGWMKFGRGLEEPESVDTDLVVREAVEGAEVAAVVAAGYGVPESVAAAFEPLTRLEEWHCFVATLGNEPVGTGALFVHEGVGWLGAAATLPDKRRLGAQNALLAARVARGREAGCEALTVETGKQTEDRPSNSYRNILRAGFRELYVRPNYLSPQ
jgi:GNAT superfamily N-acetyltransferase